MTTANAASLATIDLAMQPHLGRIARREVLCAAAGLKPVRVMVPEQALAPMLQALEGAGLAATTGTEIAWIAQDEGKGGWSSDSAKPGEGEAFRHVYVARTAEQAEQLRAAEASGSPESFGRLLLVPACCRAMFIDRCVEAAETAQNDFMGFSFPQPCCTVPWTLNLGAQYFDASLISHYPCSPRCADSLRLAWLAWRIVRAASPDLASGMRSSMRRVALYTERLGVHLLDGGAWGSDGWIAVSGDGPASTVENELAALLRKAVSLRVLPHGIIAWRTVDGEGTLAAEGARLLVPEPVAEETTP